MSGWYLQTGKDKARMFYTPYNDHRCWTDDRSLAQRFDTKSEATIVQAEIVAELGLPVACVSEAVTPR